MAAWIWWTSGGVLAILGVTVLLWSLFQDRSRGRARCPRCWYDMAESPGLICPECGHDAGKNRRLYRTRRRRRAALIGALMLVSACATPIVTHAQRHGVWSLMPWFVLVRLVEPDVHTGNLKGRGGTTPDPAWDELVRRGGVSAMPTGLWPFFLRHSGVIDAPETWVAGQRIPVRLNGFNREIIEILVEAEGVEGRVGGHAVEMQGMTVFFSETRDLMLLDPRDAGRRMIKCEVVVHAGTQPLPASSKTLWEGAVHLEIDVVPPESWTLEPSPNAEMLARFDRRWSLTRTQVDHAMCRLTGVLIGGDLPDPDTYWFEPSIEVLTPMGAFPLEMRMEPKAGPRGTGSTRVKLWNVEGVLPSEALVGEIRARVYGAAPTHPQGVRTRRYWTGEMYFDLESRSRDHFVWAPAAPPGGRASPAHPSPSGSRERE